MDINDRFFLVIEHYGFTPSIFADKLGINRSMITHIKTKRNRPSQAILQKVYQVFPDLNPRWLEYGLDQMLTSKNVAAQKVSNSFKNSLFDDNTSSNNASSNRTYQAPQESKSTPPPPKSFNNYNQSDKPPIENTANTESFENKDVVNALMKNKNILKIVVFFDDNTFAEYS